MSDGRPERVPGPGHRPGPRAVRPVPRGRGQGDRRPDGCHRPGSRSSRWSSTTSPSPRTCDIDLRARTIRIERSITELPGGGYLYGPPKSEAGKRRVAIPAHITADLKAHLAAFVAPGADALIFTSPTGAPLRHSNFRRRVWVPALAEAGLTELHFHDLRRTGNDLTAGTGATLREMMDRMGHSSPRAALVYMHWNDARQRGIADSLRKLARSKLSRTGQRAKEGTRGKPSGTQRARKSTGAP